MAARTVKISELIETNRLENSFFPVSQEGITKKAKFEKIKDAVQTEFLTELAEEAQNRKQGDIDTLAKAKEYVDTLTENLPVTDIIEQLADEVIKREEMGAPDGVATLDAQGKVPVTQLPGFESGAGGGIEEAPNDGKIYGRKNEAWAEIDSITLEGGDNLAELLAIKQDKIIISTTADLIEDQSDLVSGMFYMYNFGYDFKLYLGNANNKARLIYTSATAASVNPAQIIKGNLNACTIGMTATLYKRRNNAFSIWADFGNGSLLLKDHVGFTVMAGSWELIAVGMMDVVNCNTYLKDCLFVRRS